MIQAPSLPRIWSASLGLAALLLLGPACMDEGIDSESSESQQSDDPDDPGDPDDIPDHKTAICHIPPGNPDNAHTIVVGNPAVPAHMAHGDVLGACEGDGEGDDGSDDGGDVGDDGSDDGGDDGSDDGDDGSGGDVGVD